MASEAHGERSGEWKREADSEYFRVEKEQPGFIEKCISIKPLGEVVDFSAEEANSLMQGLADTVDAYLADTGLTDGGAADPEYVWVPRSKEIEFDGRVVPAKSDNASRIRIFDPSEVVSILINRYPSDREEYFEPGFIRVDLNYRPYNSVQSDRRLTHEEYNGLLDILEGFENSPVDFLRENGNSYLL